MTTVSSILVEIKAMAGEFTAAFRGIQSDVEKLNAKIAEGNELLTSMGTALAAFVGFRAMGDSIKAADDLKAAMAQLDAVLASTGQGSAAVRAEMVELAETEESLTGIHKDQILSIEGILFSFGATADQVKKVLPLVLDISAATGRSAIMVARSLGEATQGQSQALLSLGLPMKQLGSQVRDFDSLMDLLGTRWRGQAQAMFEARGETDKFQLAMYRLKESLGGVVESTITPFLAHLNEQINALAEKLKNFTKDHAQLAQILKDLVTDLGMAAVRIVPFVAGLFAVKGAISIFNSLAGMINLVGFTAVNTAARLSAINLALGGMSYMLMQLGAAVAGFFAGWQLGKLIGDLHVAGLTINQWTQEIYIWFAAMWEKIAAYTIYAWEAMKSPIAQFMSWLRVEWDKMILYLAERWNNSPLKRIHVFDTDAMRADLAAAQAAFDAAISQGDSGARATLNKRLADIDAWKKQVDSLIEKKSSAAAQASATAPASSPATTLTGPNEQADNLFESIRKLYYQTTNQKRELLDQEYADKLAEIEKELAGDSRKYEAERMLHAAYLAQIARLDEEAQKQRDETLKRLAEQRTRELEEIDRQQKEKQRQEEEEQENRRAALRGQIAMIGLNPLTTQNEKIAAQLPLERQLLELGNQRAEALKRIIADQSTDAQARLDAQKELNDLMVQQAELAQKINDEQNRGSFGYQFGIAITDQKNKWVSWAKSSADAFTATWSGAQNAISSGFSRLFEYGAQRGQWFREIWNGIVESMIGSMVKMTVNWIMNHVVMEAATRAFTAVTTALHIGAEATKTAATRAGATARIAANASEAGAGAAASQAGIPLIGPILAVAAMGAVVASVMALMGGFAGGGYTGDGPLSQVAGVVHRGEYVMSAPAVSRIGLSRLEAMHRGYAAGGYVGEAPATAGGQTNVHNAVYFDRQKMVDELAKSDAHEKFIVDVMARNIHKFRA